MIGKRILFLFLFGLVLELPRLGLADTLPSQGAKPIPEEDARHGAVLCVWYLFREAREMGDMCFGEKDSKLQGALDAAIGRIDKFIIVNAPMSPSKLRDIKKERGLMDPPDMICKADEFYERFRRQGVNGINHAVDALLAVPRRPALAPCL